MTKTKTAKALLASVLALVLCLSMLIGTTFAWFTDSVTSANNIIKSGTLDVEMQWADGKTDPANTTWTDASTGAIFNYDLWEPGYTEVRHIQIANVGTLALKYQLNILANGEVSDLANVIDVYYADPAVQVADRTALDDSAKIGTLTEVLAQVSTSAAGELLAGESCTITLALKMQESAGNEYQNKEIGSDFSVQLLATQLTAEEDSFDDQYDADAVHPDQPTPSITVTTAEELENALENVTEETVINAEGVELAVSDQFFNLSGGVTLKGATVDTKARGGAYIVAKAGPGETLSFENCTIKRSDLGANIIAGDADGANIVFENCTFEGPVMPNMVDRAEGTIEFIDCTFKVGTAFMKQGYVNCMGGTTTFTNCTFDYTGGNTSGSNQYVRWNAVNSYSESGYSTAVILNGCTRINCGTQKYGPNSTLTIQ